MNQHLILIILVLLIFISGCDVIVSIRNAIPGMTEDIPIDINCGDVGLGAFAFGMTTEQIIQELCQSNCLSNYMKYADSYKCEVPSKKLVCVCLVTPERREYLRTKGSEEVQEKQWINPIDYKGKYNGTLRFDEETGLFTFEYANKNPLETQVCLEVRKGWDTVCEKCLSGEPSGIITCNISSYGYDGEYYAHVLLELNDQKEIFRQLWKNFNKPLSFD